MSVCLFCLSVLSVCFVCLSVLSVCLFCLSVCFVCLSFLSVCLPVAEGEVQDLRLCLKSADKELKEVKEERREETRAREVKIMGHLQKVRGREGRGDGWREGEGGRGGTEGKR